LRTYMHLAPEYLVKSIAWESF